ncbi:FecCD family ABC transporter permease [Paenibacillus koleovorans]|uniref:FecCD family ABC transporter permease n=1 Tax=Paenibacillus koleovorans TaxID=121608 RepID=UPI000FDAB320|nr:iron ABC transporter permease [Paenibacillus koleovorans]
MRLSNKLAVWLLLLSPLAIAAAFFSSVWFGSKSIGPDTVWDAIMRFDPDNVQHQIVQHSRIPRAIGGLLIGAFLAVSGALMQGMTRNYLASPSIMGVSDGSAFAITLCTVFLPGGASSMEMIVFSLIGSALAVALVFGLASLLPDGLSPLRMAIIGTIIGTFLSSMSAAVASYFQVSQTISFWYNARLHQMDPDMIRLAIPFAVVGLALALLLSKSITVLALGEDVAMSLGQRTLLVKAGATTAVILLTGISVALAGKIGFVGLIIPHIVRFLIGVDYRWVIPCSAVVGAVFLGFSDVASRYMNAPFETPIGVVTAIVGVPFFLYLVRKRGGRHA